MEEAFDEPIDYFQFRQMPAEFKLKLCPEGMESPAWAAEVTPRASLLAISHRKGLIMYPHYERGAVAFASIANLAEKDYLPSEAIGFPGDESFITAMCLSADDTHLLVAKQSGKLYSLDLAVDNSNKKPFLSKITKIESMAVQLLAIDETVLVVGESGKVSQFQIVDLKEVECKYTLEGVSCVAKFEKSIVFGFKYLNKLSIYGEEQKTVEVPVESGLGISSLHFASENVILCSIKPTSESEDVNLIVFDSVKQSFRSFMDPCASRPPGPNQFYFTGLNDWSTTDLIQLVAVANRNSPDIGVAGRLNSESDFGTFFIDNDEGLAQLPLINSGKTLTFPLGLAIDFTSTFKHENRQDPDAEPFHPAPILWILTTSGQLCPFAMLKSNESGPWPFMKTAPTLTLSPPRPLVIQAPQSDADDTSPSLAAQQPELLSASSSTASLSVSTFSSEEEDEVSESVPATPSKMSLSAITSLQKSAEKLSETVKPIEPIPFKLVTEATDKEKMVAEKEKSAPSQQLQQTPPLQQPQSAQPFKFEFPKTEIKTDKNGTFKVEIAKPEINNENKASPASSTSSVPVAVASPMSIVSQEPTIPPPVKKEEKMESITSNPYQSILLAEVAEAHASMQNDLHELKLLAYKNSILLRQNTSKYFQSLEALESYANKVEALLGSGERVFGALKEKTESLRMNFDEIRAQSKRLNAYLQGIKHDARIDWQAKAARLDELCSDVCRKISQLRELFASKASKATISLLHQSIQERLQAIVVHLSNLFVFTGETEAATLERIKTLCLSSDSLVDEMGALLIAEPETDAISARKQRQNRLLEAAKARGARMLIPQVRSETSKAAPIVAKPVTGSIDDQLVNAFITSVKLSDPVPEFRDNNAPIIAQPSANPFAVKKEEPKPASFAFAPVVHKEATKKEELKPSAPAIEKKEESKSFSFASVEKKEEPKSFSFISTEKKEEPKPFSFASVEKKEEPKPFSFASVEKKEETKPFSFASLTTKEEQKPVTVSEEKKPFSFSFTPEPTKKPEESKPVEQKTFSFGPIEKKEESVEKKEESKPEKPKTISVATVEKNEEPKSFSFASVEKKEEPKPFSFISTEKKEEPKSFSFAPVVKEEPKSFSFAPTATAATKPNDNPFAFKFDFTDSPKPPAEEPKTEPIKTEAETEKKPIPAIFGLSPESSPTFAFTSPSTSSFASPTTSTTTTTTTSTPAIPALLTSQNAFAPAALTGTQTSPAFSVTSTPTFGTPTFGQTSLPAFGQTSLPTSAIPPASSTLNPNAAAPKPGAFAAFAQNSQGLGFSSFAAPQGQAGTGLSFANFSANANTNKDAEKKEKPGFNFSGFRG